MGVATPTAVAEEEGKVGAEGRLEADVTFLVAGFSLGAGHSPEGEAEGDIMVKNNNGSGLESGRGRK